MLVRLFVRTSIYFISYLNVNVRIKFNQSFLINWIRGSVAFYRDIMTIKIIALRLGSKYVECIVLYDYLYDWLLASPIVDFLMDSVSLLRVQS